MANGINLTKSTHHTHISYICWSTPYLLKAIVLPPFWGVGGLTSKTQNKTNKSAPMQGNHCHSWTAPQGAKTNLHSCCPPPSYPLAPTPRLVGVGWVPLCIPSGPHAVLHLPDSFKIVNQMPSSAHDYWIRHYVCQRTHTGLNQNYILHGSQNFVAFSMQQVGKQAWK